MAVICYKLGLGTTNFRNFSLSQITRPPQMLENSSELPAELSEEKSEGKDDTCRKKSENATDTVSVEDNTREKQSVTPAKRSRSSSSSDTDSFHSINSSSSNIDSKSNGSLESSARLCSDRRTCLRLPPELSISTRSAGDDARDNPRTHSPSPPSPVEVPVDPRVWTSSHIAGWVKWMTKQFKIVPEPDTSRFPTTGAELCTMSRAEFWVCAGSREGGILFAKHFALMLHNATGRETSPMLRDDEPSKFKLQRCYPSI